MDSFIFSWLIAGVMAGLFTNQVLRGSRETLVPCAVPVSARIDRTSSR